jgi:hypothetical protein
MPARRRAEHHWYTVWVNGETDSTKVYSGSSEIQARNAFAKAVMQQVHAVSVEIRRDFKPWLRVLIERQP